MCVGRCEHIDSDGVTWVQVLEGSWLPLKNKKGETLLLERSVNVLKKQEEEAAAKAEKAAEKVGVALPHCVYFRSKLLLSLTANTSNFRVDWYGDRKLVLRKKKLLQKPKVVLGSRSQVSTVIWLVGARWSARTSVPCVKTRCSTSRDTNGL